VARRRARQSRPDARLPAVDRLAAGTRIGPQIGQSSRVSGPRVKVTENGRAEPQAGSRVRRGYLVFAPCVGIEILPGAIPLVPAAASFFAESTSKAFASARLATHRGRTYIRSRSGRACSVSPAEIQPNSMTRPSRWAALIRAAGTRCERTSDRLRWGHGLPTRGNNHLNICRYGSPLDGIPSIAFLAKGLACSSVCRLSFGSGSRLSWRPAYRERPDWITV
jgi:hypothetical protein